MKSMKWSVAAGVFVAVASVASVGCGEGGTSSSAAAPVGADEAGIQKIERDLAPVLSRSAEGLAVQAVPGGGQRVDLGGRFQSAAVAKIGADGKLVVDCVDTVDEASAFLRGAAAAAKKADER
jgi:hypothetical protein